MLKILSIFFVLAIGTTASFSQRGPQTPEQLERALEKASFREKFEAANDLYYQQNYYYALIVFQNLIKEKPDNAHLNYKLGVCYLKSNSERTKALSHLEKVISKITRNFDTYSHTDDSAPYEAYYFLGQAYHLDYQFDNSIKYFNIFKDQVSKKHKLRSDADLHISQCLVGKEMIKSPRTDVTIKNLGPKINSEFSDFSPVVTLDDEVLYFTSRRVRKDSSNIDEFSIQDGKHYEDIYVSYKDANGEWGEPSVLSFSEIDRNEATISVSADGAEIFAYIDDAGDGNIYYSSYQDTNFSELTKLAEDVSDINTDSWEPHATVTPDGNTLYFVSDRKGGFGGRDLYIAKKLPNGEWGMAQNLGPTVNSPDDEDSPYIAADGKTLYFSSNGITSMGGFDVFVTEQNETGQWIKPTNLRYPINTVDDDVFFIVDASGTRGYFSSLHEEKHDDSDHGKDIGYGEKDIYEIIFDENTDELHVAIFKGKIVPKKGELIPSSLEIYATNLTTGEQQGPFRPRQDDGGYVVVLEPCNDYKVEYLIDDEIFKESEFTVPCEADYQTFHSTIYLDPTELDTAKSVDLPLTDMVRWKVINAPSEMAGKSITYYNSQGENDGTSKIGEDLIFSYPNTGHNYTYMFEIMNQPEIICKSVCFALIDSLDKVLGYAIRKDDCAFFYENLDSKWQLVDKTGKAIENENITILFKDSDGNISFEEKLGCNGMFAYHPLKADGSTYAELSLEDLKLCDEMEMILLDKNNKPIGKTTRDEKCRFTYEQEAPCLAESAAFSKFYGYNKKGQLEQDAKFKIFIEAVSKLIECNEVASIEIESSASKVPTTTFKSNQNLAQYRANDAKLRIISALKAKGISEDQFKFISINAQVLGPQYRNDASQNRALYEKYQFVKLTVR